MLRITALVGLSLLLGGCGTKDEKSLSATDCGEHIRYANGTCSTCPYDERPVDSVALCVPCASNSVFNGTDCHFCQPPLIASKQGCTTCPADFVYSAGRCVPCEADTCATSLRRSPRSDAVSAAPLETVTSISTSATRTEEKELVPSKPQTVVGRAVLAPVVPPQLSCSATQVWYLGECTDCVKHGLVKSGDACVACDYRSIPLDGECLPCKYNEYVMQDPVTGFLICSHCPAPYALSQGICVPCEGTNWAIMDFMCVASVTTTPTTLSNLVDTNPIPVTTQSTLEAVSIEQVAKTEELPFKITPSEARTLCGHTENSLLPGGWSAYLVLDEKSDNKLIFGYIDTVAEAQGRYEVTDAKIADNKLTFTAPLRENLYNAGIISDERWDPVLSFPLSQTSTGLTVDLHSITGHDLILSRPVTGTCKDVLRDAQGVDSYINELL